MIFIFKNIETRLLDLWETCKVQIKDRHFNAQRQCLQQSIDDQLENFTKMYCSSWFSKTISGGIKRVSNSMIKWFRFQIDQQK